MSVFDCTRDSRVLRVTIAIMVVGVAALALAACGGGGSSTVASESTKEGNGEKEAASGDGGSGGGVKTVAELPASMHLEDPSPALCGDGTYTIGHDRFSSSDETVIAMSNAIDEAAKATGCVEILRETDDADPATLLRNVETFVQRSVDGAIVQDDLSEVQPEVIQRLESAGIPAVAMSTLAPNTTFVGGSDIENGEIGGKGLAEAFEAEFEGATPVLVVQEVPKGGEAAEERTDGFIKGVEGVLPEISTSDVFKVSSEFEESDAHDRTLEALGRVPSDSKIMVAGLSDTMARAMLRAVEQRGLGEDALAAGIGGTPGFSTELICENPRFAGTTAQFPEKQGTVALTALLNEINGKQLPEKIQITGEFLDKENLKQIYPEDAC